MAAVAMVLLAGAFTGCRREQPLQEEKRLVVFAAASLRDVFTRLGDDFRKSHPGTELTFNFAGTQELRTQLAHGASADVFASADMLHMDALVREARVEEPVVFSRNGLVIVVTPEAAAKVTDLSQLHHAQRIVVGAREVPIGRYTAQVLERAKARLGDDFPARVQAKVVSRELNVRQVLTKVRLGEAEAGIVYRTDAHGLTDVVTVELPEDVNVIAGYPAAVVVGAPHPKGAAAFVALLRSEEGQRRLAEAGFLPAREASGSPEVATP